MSRRHDSGGGEDRRDGLYDPVFEKESCGIGLVANVKGVPERPIVEDALQVLRNMSHRGACGCEPNTGDGAGILTALPHAFLRRVAESELGVQLPPPGAYAAGLVFLPQAEEEARVNRAAVETAVVESGQRVIGWRPVPTDAAEADLGSAALRSEPRIEQLLVARAEALPEEEFERRLYLIRKVATRRIQDGKFPGGRTFYVCSLSSRLLVYKGMLTPEQLPRYYPELNEPDFASHLAVVHSRFSTNTFPSWSRAQPLRMSCHNGEINTLRGNLNWMRARESVLRSELFGDQLRRLFPVLEPDTSDSGNFDNMLEFLTVTGRSPVEAVMMMIPEAWQSHPDMDPDRRAFYEFNSCLMEPWDGPAAIIFTDGLLAGAVLDRNGLRPGRYCLTCDDRAILASEAGVLPVEPDRVVSKGRLQPGRMFLIDFQQGRVIPDREARRSVAEQRPYRRWLRERAIRLEDLVRGWVPGRGAQFDPQTLHQRLRAFGYTTETLQFQLLPMVKQGRDPVGSMGNDSVLACLSDQPRMLSDYFKQLFAQVTNPAIDSIREEVIMSLESYVGPERNLLQTSPDHCRRLRLRHPVLTHEELQAVRQMRVAGRQARTIDITFGRDAGAQGLETALERICRESSTAVDEGCALVVLSDRAVGSTRVPISSLLACGGVHHHLIRAGKRTRVGVLVETGEARDVHQLCLLLGYGADAVNPYLAVEALWQARRDGLLASARSDADVLAAYRKACGKGILKVMAKMGISTLQSYRGAQIFEALGLADEVVHRCFTGTPSRIQGVGFRELTEESLRRHELGYPLTEPSSPTWLPNPGQFHWRAGGERRLWDPEAISHLQSAARHRDAEAYWRFSRHANAEAESACTLRGLLRVRVEDGDGPVPLEEVEPAQRIVRRFCTGAMSFGSISAETHETLAVAMNRLGGRSNTGEGGEDPERFLPSPDGDSRRSAIKQVASGRFGVTIWYLVNADELQIKIAQGAKPGEGGELPGRKVGSEIARIRHSTPGVGLISPPPHHDIYSIEDLKQLIHDLKHANPEARVSVKLVSEAGVGTIAAGVAKAHADAILISGDSGGTGASPLTSIKHAGLPWELGLAETQQTLVRNGLRSRVVLQTDGGLRTGRDVVVAALLGAEEFGLATAPLVALGCIMMRKCHLNTCPVGIATQDPALRRKFSGAPEHLVNYLFMVAEEARRMMARLGLREFDELVGRSDLLESRAVEGHWKAARVNLSCLLRPPVAAARELRRTRSQDHGLERALDHRLIAQTRPALEHKERVEVESPVRNTDLAVGTMLSHRVVKQWGEDGLPEDTMRIRLRGSAGQSLGAFLARGVTLDLEGEANDYVGKGLSGGWIIVRPPEACRYRPEEQIIVGNAVLYGATSGLAFFRGRAAERFCVRNSGALTVVEGVGDHGCEYMTGGLAVILGPVGRNFAAGMSGGIAYVWDPNGAFRRRCNTEMVEIETPKDDSGLSEFWKLIHLHHLFTGSGRAEEVLRRGPEVLGEFRRVIPLDYKRAVNSGKVPPECLGGGLEGERLDAEGRN